MTAGAFKFRANNDWAYNYGAAPASVYSLVAGGSDILITLEDDYAVSMNLTTPNEYWAMANRWGLIGSATPGGWDNDSNMTYDAVNGVFKVTLDLAVGKIKFRANDGWDVNLGGDLGALTYNGADIDVVEAGNYTVTLNPFAFIGTLTKN
jgi:hypothetical protein